MTTITTDQTPNYQTSPKTKSRKPKPSYSTLVPQHRGRLLIFLIVSLSLHVLSLLILFFLSLGLWRSATRPVPTLVQVPTGETLQVKGASSTYRESQVIQDFVGQMATLLFTWSNQFEVIDEAGESLIESDSGVELGEVVVPSSVFDAGFALEESFRVSFLKKIAPLIPQGVWEGNRSTFLKIRHLSEPLALEPGKWKVEVVADLLVFSAAHPEGLSTPFNKEFFIQAIQTPPLIPEIETPLTARIYEIRASQLEIYQIKSLETNNDQ